jgi:hypothetical protein
MLMLRRQRFCGVDVKIGRSGRAFDYGGPGQKSAEFRARAL